MDCKLLDPRGPRRRERERERDRSGQYFHYIKLLVVKLFINIISNEKDLYFNLTYFLNLGKYFISLQLYRQYHFYIKMDTSLHVSLMLKNVLDIL